MGVIHGYHAPAGDGRGPLDRQAAELFLRSQTSWLRQGLDRACDEAAVRVVLASHDTSHASWLALIAAVSDTVGAESADTLAALYAYCGRVAGALCRGPDPRLSPTVAACVRSQLAIRLTELTDAAIAALSRSPASSAEGVPATQTARYARRSGAANEGSRHDRRGFLHP